MNIQIEMFSELDTDRIHGTMLMNFSDVVATYILDWLLE